MSEVDDSIHSAGAGPTRSRAGSAAWGAVRRDIAVLVSANVIAIAWAIASHALHLPLSPSGTGLVVAVLLTCIAFDLATMRRRVDAGLDRIEPALRSRRAPFRPYLDAFVAVTFRDPDTRALLAELLTYHDQMLARYPRTRSWRLFVHTRTAWSIVRHLGTFKALLLLDAMARKATKALQRD